MYSLQLSALSNQLSAISFELPAPSFEIHVSVAEVVRLERREA